jgi:hypothetical protein
VVPEPATTVLTVATPVPFAGLEIRKLNFGRK